MPRDIGKHANTVYLAKNTHNFVCCMHAHARTCTHAHAHTHTLKFHYLYALLTTKAHGAKQLGNWKGMVTLKIQLDYSLKP